MRRRQVCRRSRTRIAARHLVFAGWRSKGLGTDAKLYLNGRRIVPRSSISWGFWAPNGIFPDEAAAQTRSGGGEGARPGFDSKPPAHAQGRRCWTPLIARDCCATARLEAACSPSRTRRQMPPGPPSRPTPPASRSQLDFLNRYQLDKELAMIRAFRSHPCVSLWTLQNETSPDLNNPRMLLRAEQNAPGRSFEDDPA